MPGEQLRIWQRERVDGEPAPHGFISCQVTLRDYEQFYSDQEYMNAYMSTSSQSARGWTLHDMLHAS
jgi:hypothetical protein